MSTRRSSNLAVGDWVEFRSVESNPEAGPHHDRIETYEGRVVALVGDDARVEVAVGGHGDGRPVTVRRDLLTPAEKPAVKMVGQDGNAFAILGRCHRAARRAGWSPERWEAFREEATSGDYNRLLAKVMDWFEVDGEGA